jgi:glycosyltransferase involved in cell wall biosynthesis
MQGCDPIPPLPRVSVIVPAYNAAWCLPDALESIIAQRYPDWEAIVVDDGSTDDTARLAEGRDPRIRVVRSPINQGLAATRNLGLDHATGELVALLDADDTWLPDYLEEQVALVDRADAAGLPVAIACCDAYLRRNDEVLTETYGDWIGRPSDSITLEELIDRNPIFISVLLSRAAVEAAGRFDASLRSVEDLDLWLRIVEAGGRVVYQPKPLAVYRLSDRALSRDTVTMTRSRQIVLRRALDRGHLTVPQRRAAERTLRTQRAAEQVALARGELGRRPVEAAGRIVRIAPLLGRIAADRVGRRR